VGGEVAPDTAVRAATGGRRGSDLGVAAEVDGDGMTREGSALGWSLPQPTQVEIDGIFDGETQNQQAHLSWPEWDALDDKALEAAFDSLQEHDFLNQPQKRGT
jgi:hypothetical protein